MMMTSRARTQHTAITAAEDVSDKADATWRTVTCAVFPYWGTQESEWERDKSA